MHRFRIRFSKLGPARYAGHLDLHRAWERALRRAGAPLAYSEGFHPQPKIQLASALPLGFTSEAEIADIWLREDLAPEALLRDLRPALPPGIDAHSVEPVAGKQKSLQSRLRAAEYRVELPYDPSGDDLDLDARVHDLLAQPQVIRHRRKREYDLRALILELRALNPAESDGRGLSMRLSAQEGATGRPEEVLAALGVEGCAARIHRTRLIFVDNSS